MKTKKPINPSSGYTMLIILALLLSGLVLGFVSGIIFAWILILPIILILPGFFIVNPNGSKVLVLFGAYKGTVKENGFFWANPFLSKQRISLRARNFDSERVKVNDKIGNPILNQCYFGLES